MSDEQQRTRRKRGVLALIAAAVILTPIVGAVAAQQTDTPQPIEENATYYDDENGTTNTSEWVPNDGNATAGGILEMVSRIPAMFVGTGGMDPSGSGVTGYLLTGLVIGGATLFAVVGIGIGPIAGSMIGIVLAFGLTTVGLIPVWIQPLLLFTLVGVPASAAIIRVFRG